MKLNDCKLLGSKIVGYEKAIVQIIEKWNVCERDVDKIIDYMALIEANTIKLVYEKEKEKKYLRRIYNEQS